MFFLGCPSVRPVLVMVLSQEPIDGFLLNLGHVLDLGVKGHGAQYICKNSL